MATAPARSRILRSVLPPLGNRGVRFIYLARDRVAPRQMQHHRENAPLNKLSKECWSAK